MKDWFIKTFKRAYDRFWIIFGVVFFLYVESILYRADMASVFGMF